MSWQGDRCRERRGRWTWWALAFGLLLAPVAAGAQPAESRRAAADRVAGAFEVFPVQDGVLLRPREGDLASIELRDGDWAIEGVPVDEEELADRLGARAELLRPLATWSGEELHAAFGFGRRTEAPEAPEAPAAPEPETLEVPLEGDVGDEIEARRREIEAQAEEARARADEIRSSAEERLREVRRRTTRHSTDARVVLGSAVTVEVDETTGEVVAIGGPVTVEGEVMGGAVSVGGRVRVSGTVMGDVVAIGGGVVLEPTASVMGDVVSVGGGIDRAPGAEVMGQISEVNLGFGTIGPWRWGDVHWGDRPFVDDAVGDFASGAIRFVLVAAFGALALLLFRRRMEGVAVTIGREPVRAGLVGLVSLVLFVPAVVVVVLLLAISLIGIPLLLLVPFAVVAFLVLAFLGYVAAAYRLGRWSEERFGWRLDGPFLALLIGLVLLHAWTITGDAIDIVDGSRDFAAPLVIALVFFGFVLKVCAWSVGLGGILMSRFRPAAVDPIWSSAPPPVPPTSPAPPTPPPATEERSSGIFWPQAAEPDLRWEEPEGSSPGGDEAAAEPGEGPEPPGERDDEREGR